jgi:TrmH family RNA methyltransferase
LHRRKARREQGAFLIEGVRLLRDALDAHAAIRQIVLCPAMLGESGDAFRREIAAALDAPRILTVTPSVMRSLADTESPQGVVAVIDLPETTLPAFTASDAFLLVLDGLRDPGNVGALMRTAAAAGCDAVIAIAGGADPFAPKVVRSAMGAHFRLTVIADATWATIGPALAELPAVVGAATEALAFYDAIDWTAGCALVIGNEDYGLSHEACAWCKGMARIPMTRGVESLNAAVSGAIILYEVVRQRRQAGTA